VVRNFMGPMGYISSCGRERWKTIAVLHKRETAGFYQEEAP
jgi:hypothetical protein